MTAIPEKSQRERFWIQISTLAQWYAIMRECRTWFGRDWACQGKVRSKLTRGAHWAPRMAAKNSLPMEVWFEVPDPRFATWISVKLSLQVQSDRKRNTHK